MIWRNIFSVRVNFSFYRTLWLCRIKYLSWFDEIFLRESICNFHTALCDIDVAFTKFLPKKRESEFPEFLHSDFISWYVGVKRFIQWPKCWVRDLLHYWRNSNQLTSSKSEYLLHRSYCLTWKAFLTLVIQVRLNFVLME